MTEQEKDSIIAAMVRERRELRSTITCIKHRLDWATKELVRADQYIRDAHNGSISGEEAGLDYPNADELMSLLEEYRTATARLKELGTRLDMC